MQVDPA